MAQPFVAFRLAATAGYSVTALKSAAGFHPALTERLPQRQSTPSMRLDPWSYAHPLHWVSLQSDIQAPMLSPLPDTFGRLSRP